MIYIKRVLCVIAFLCLSQGFIGCAVLGSNASGYSESSFRRALLEEELSNLAEEEMEVPDYSQRYYNYLKAELAVNRGDLDDAIEFFERTAELDTTSAPVLRARLAKLYVQTGRLDDALREVELARKDNPEDLSLLQLQGGVLSALKRSEEAAAIYEQIIAQDVETRDDAYILLANLYAQDGKYIEAKKILERLVKKKPDSFFGYYYLGRMEELGQEYKLAIKHYRQALKRTKQALQIKLDIVRVLGIMKRYKDAIRECREVVEQYPRHVGARNLLGQLLLAENQVDDAIEQFETIGTLAPNSYDAQLKIALIKLQRRDYESAAVDLNLIVAAHPELGKARYYLATTLVGLKQINEALEHLKAVQPEHEFFVESKTFAAYLLRESERYSEAEAFLEEVADKNPKNLKILSLLAATQQDAKNISGAIKTVEKMIAIEPENDRHYFTLGVFYDSANKESRAIEAMEKAIELNRKNVNALNYLAYTLAERGERLDEAAGLIKEALAVEPENGYFIDTYGWILFKMDRFSEALDALEKASQLVPTDAVILEHYAVALLRKENNEGVALEVLKKALRYASQSDDEQVGSRLESLIKKLEKE